MKRVNALRITRAIVSIILALVLIIQPYGMIMKAEGESSIPVGNESYVSDMKVSVTIDSYWKNHYNVRIKLTNESEETIHSWCIGTRTRDKIEGLYNAIEISDSLGKDEEAIKVFKYVPGNQDILPGNSIEFGYTAVYKDVFDVPSQFIDATITKEVSNQLYSVRKSVVSNWGNGSICNISIKNRTNETIEDWTIEFDSKTEIKEVWDGKLVKSNNGHYVITNPGYNQNINANQQVTIGVLTGKNTKASIDNVRIYCVTENEIHIMFPSEERDTDGDGLPDMYEDEIGTDKTMIDTDGDSLSDYDEVVETLTDPLVYDSVISGVSDADADVDSDGLSNKYELEIGTDPFFDDSDFDGIKDNEELNNYKTNPVVRDTDCDGIIDGDEIKMGLNPLKPDSDDDGINDSDEIITQTVSRDNYEDEIFNENIAIPTISVNAKGNINNKISIEYVPTYLIGDERAIIGKGVDISNSPSEGGTITFKLPSDYEFEKYVLDGNETEGLIIEYYDKKSVTPLKTTVDTVNKTVSANLAGDGWYYILYLPGYLNIFGYDMPTDGNAVLDSNGMYIEAQTYTDLVEEDTESFENVEENADEEAIDTEFETEEDNEDESSVLDEDDTVDEIEDIEEKEEDKSEEDILEKTEESEFDEINYYSDLKDSKLTNLRLNGFEAEVINVDNASDANKEKNSNKIKNVNAMVDIVFVFDTTGSMGSAVNKTYKNIGEFADKLAAEGISVSYGLIDYRDITEYNGKYDSRIVKNGYSNWYNTNEGIKNALSGLTIDGGGDGDECALDGLALSEKIGFRSNAQKFIILVTDAASKNDNNFGKTSFDEMADAFAKEDICVSVIAPDYTSCHDDYDVLCSKTNGIYVNIYSDFAKELLKIADKIKENSKGYWIALDTPVPTIIKLNEEPKLGSTVDTDKDTIVDCDELDIEGSQIRSVGFNLQLERAYGGDTRFDYKQLKVYSFNTNPARYDSDGDGMGDQWDSEPLNYKVGMIIYQTKKVDSVLKEIPTEERKDNSVNDCPEDWKYQDISKEDLLKYKTIDSSYFSDDITLEKATLEYEMGHLVKFLSSFDNNGMSEVSYDIIRNFMDGDGKDFRNSKLNEAIETHEDVIRYKKSVSDIVNEYLKIHNGDLSGLKYSKEIRDKNELIYGVKDESGKIVFPGMAKKEGVDDILLVTQPNFSRFSDNINGLGICVHDLYGVQIELSYYDESTGEFTIRYTFYDIFGLDKEDIEDDGFSLSKDNTFEFGKIRGFADWYILQHYNKYTEYKPFLTYMQFEERLQSI